MSNKTYDILKFAALIIVPIVNFIFLVLTALGKLEAGIATVILGGLDALVGAIVTAANEVWKRKNEEITEEIVENEEEEETEEE